MIQEGIIVDQGRRVLSRPPSQEIAYLADLTPKLFGNKGGGVCPAVTSNGVGALLLYKNRHLYVEDFANSGFPIPKVVDAPVQFIPKVQVSVYDRLLGRYLDTGLVAEDVMMKRIGIRVGIVLSGELAGLVLRPERALLSSDKRMYAVRVLNDHEVAKRGYPYLPEYPTPWSMLAQSIADVMRGEVPRVKKYWDIVRHQKLRYNLAYHHAVDKANRNDSSALESDIMFELLKSVGKVVDQENFHRTIARNANGDQDPLIEALGNEFDQVMINRGNPYGT